MTMPAKHRYWSVLAVVAAIGAGAILLNPSSGVDDPPAAMRASQAGAASTASGRAALTVTVTRPRQEAWPTTLAANGSIAAWQEIVVGSEISGVRLTHVLVNVGDRVDRGQVLARLSEDTVRAEHAQILASLAEARAMLADAKANAARARKLESGGAISAQQVAQYLTAEQTAAARVDAQRARLRAEEVRLAHTRIVAPERGIVSARSATVGSLVQPGAELFRLIREGRLEWRAEVTGAELPRVAPGQVARIEGADGSTIEGRVRIVAPTIDPRTRVGIVYVDVPASGAARAGMFARGEIEIGRSTALTVPQSAVVLRDGFSYVFRLADDARVLQIKVRTGRRAGERIEVLEGLDAGARLVDSGAGFLADGDRVRVVESSAQ